MLPAAPHDSWLLAICALLSAALSVSPVGTPKPIAQGFPPAQGPPTQKLPGATYVGSEACAQCHAAEAKGSNAMARALEPAATCEILRRRPRLTFRKGPYSYRIVLRGGRSVYEVTDATGKISEPILWAFGLGGAGQTYVFQHGGSYYQSRVSFFKDIQGLDITLGAPDSVPTSLDDAIGTVITEEEARLCFGCHSTGAVSGDHLQLDRFTPGITCEGCHGPGGRHVAGIQAGSLQDAHIFNPSSLGTGDLVDFCGACHRTWLQVQLMHLTGVRNVRFQPYRLANSRCYDPDDKRISCLACHDPHRAVRRDAAFYDAKCIACHRVSGFGVRDQGSGKARSTKPESRIPIQWAGLPDQSGQSSSRVCNVGKKGCVTCHMPKYSLPGAHFRFTDHEIRIMRRDEPYPN